MTRRAYRKKRQNRMGMLLVTAVVLTLLVAVSINSVSLREKQAEYAAREAVLLEQIEDETERQEELVEYEKYTKTKAYYEEIAKEKLGLVYPDEIVFKAQP